MSYSQSSAFLSNLIYDRSRVNDATPVGTRYIDPQGGAWELKYFDPGSGDGYQGAVFVNVDTKAVSMVNRGTEPTQLGDIASDIQMGLGLVPSQYDSAKRVYENAIDIARAAGTAPESIVVTGHSLGGALSQLIGAKYGLQTETFNAYGAGNLMQQLGIPDGAYTNIVNHVIDKDLISVFPGSKMIGTTLEYATTTPADAFWNSPAGTFIALFRPDLKAGYELTNAAGSHSIGNFMDTHLASQPGHPVSINVPSLADWLAPFAFVSGIDTRIAATFNNFSKYPQRTDPFTLDLDGDGIETVGVNAAHPLLFDIDAIGIKKSVGWVKADDGLLALDRNGNGTIDSGAELFGNATPVFDSSGHLIRQAADGFDALAQEDSNADGIIDALDTNWNNLRVWQDANQDGISQAAELKTLAALNITAIHLAKVENSVPLANGNVLADLGSFTRSDGSQGGAGTAAQLADIDLATDSFHSQFTDAIPLTVEAASLPDIQGSGQVRSLRQAASLDTAAGHALAALLTQYSQATSKAAQMALLDPLLKAWSDTSTMATTFTGAYAGHALTVDMQGVWSPDNVSNPGTAAYQAWAAKLTIMEHFNGRTYQQVPDGTAPVTITLWHSPRDMLQLSYEALRSSVYDSLALQTRLKPYLDSIQLTITETGPSTGSGHGISLDFSQVKADFTAEIDSDPANGFADLVDFNAGTRVMLAGSGWDGTGLIVDYLGTHAMTAQLQAAFAGTGILVKGTAGWSNSGSGGDEVMIADGGNDVLYGNGGDDALYGGAGNDTLDGGTGNDTLDGGAGNDTLYGNAGSDTYVFRRGSGYDTMRVYDSATGKVDTLRLDGLNPEDIRLEKWGDDLAFVIKDTGEWARFQYFFSNPDTEQLDAVQFADGTTWNRATLLAQEVLLNGGAGDDILYGRNGGPNTLYGNNGNDTLHGGDQADQIYGGTGNDNLYGNSGNDTLDGGAGNDTLYGNAGSDTYVFRRGSGYDTMRVYDSATGKVDTLRLDGLNPEDIRLEKWGDDLAFIIKDTGEWARFQYFFQSSTDQLDAVQFADGTTWNRATLLAQEVLLNGGAGSDTLSGHNGGPNTLYGNDGNDTLLGGDQADQISGGAGNDYLAGNAGNDTLLGGEGNDTLDGGTGNDTLDGGAGNDTLYGNAGSDTYVFRRGSGYDTMRVYDSATGKVDTLRLDGLNPEDIRLEKWGDDLAFVIKDTGEWARFQYFFQSPTDQLDAVEFADGTTWNRATLIAQPVWLNGSSGNDSFNGGSGNDFYNGGDGDDTIAGNAGNDFLKGGSGNDILTGGIGNDTLDGGSGNDTLNGGEGNDTYLYALGDGHDRIIESSGADRIAFGSGISASGVAVGRNNGDIVLEISTTDSIRFVENAPGAYAVEQIEFSDGTTWLSTDILRQLSRTPPVVALSLGDQTATEDSLFQFSLPSGTFADPDSAAGDRLSVTATLADGSPLPAWLNFDAAAHSFSGMPDESAVGSVALRVIATDLAGNSIDQVFVVTVENVNDAPTGKVGVDGTAIQGQTLTATNDLDDADGLGSIGYQWQGSADGGATWAAIVGATADSFMLTEAQVGQQVRALASYTDGHGTLEQMTSVATAAVIGGANSAPTIAAPIDAQSATEDMHFIFTVPADSFADSDPGDSLSYTATLADGTALPDWLAFDTATQTFSGTPGAGSPGVLALRVTATDGGGLSAQGDFSLTVGQHLRGTGSSDTLNYSATSFVGVTLIDGGAGNDTITGSAGDDIIVGGAGSDNLKGEAGDDVFLVTGTDAGYDRFEGGAGYDIIQGSTGDDTIRLYQYTGAATVERIDGNGGNDVIAGTGYGDTLDFSGTELVGIALIDGGVGNDTITGSAGDDVIIGGSGSDVLSGGDGNDTFLIEGTDTAYDRIAGDAGYDTIQGGAGDDDFRFYQFSGANSIEAIDGGAGINRIVGTGYGDTLDLSATALTNIAAIDGGVGNDTITGSTGDDVIIGGAGSDVLSGGDGNDVFLIEGTDTAYDRITGDAGYDTIQGGAGDDDFRFYQFSGTNSIEAIDGGAGINRIVGTGYGDTLDLSATALTNIAAIDGGVGNDTITGSTGDDVIIGGVGSDVLSGGDGNDIFLIEGTDTAYDRITGDAGYDRIQGGAGDDDFRFYQFSGANSIEAIDGGAGINRIVGTGYGDTLDLSATTLINIAAITGGVGNDTITGSAGDDVIIGGSGSDVLSGGDGNDIFLIEGTDTAYDRITGDAGYDTIQGRAGDDDFRFYQFSGANSIEAIDGGAGNDRIVGTGYGDTLDLSATTLTNIAAIDGGLGNDTITGSAGDDVIVGGAGADRLVGGTGSDTYRIGRGDGADVVVENDSTAGNTDVAEFLAGIAADQIWLRHVGNNLEASVIGTGDKLTMENWYLGSNYHVEQFKTADGKLLLDSQVENLVQAMAAFAPPSAGQTTLLPAYQENLVSVIAANWQ